MPEQSHAYLNLKTGLNDLSKTFLNFAHNPSGRYSEKNKLYAKAFVVFAHTQFEDYIEGCAREILSIAENRWRNDLRTTNQTILHLCSFHSDKQKIPQELPTKNIWSERIGACINQHYSLIEQNHGISEKHFCRLFVPIGLDITKLDSVLFSDLATFSQIRGKHAHSYKSGTDFDPFDVKQKADNICYLLKEFDKIQIEFIAHLSK